jgi:hypothetical protein
LPSPVELLALSFNENELAVGRYLSLSAVCFLDEITGCELTIILTPAFRQTVKGL